MVLQGNHVGGDLILTMNGASTAAASPVVHVLSAGTPGDHGFVGRVDEQERLLRALEPPQPAAVGEPGLPVVTLSAVAGLGGIGKSALARTVALTAAGRGWFPGAVIWVDLHGFDPDPTKAISTTQLWTALLTALGVPDDRIPATEPARAVSYHSQLDQLATQDRRVLLVFDNVATADQVAELLPLPGSAATRHRILLTSRQTLAELPAQLMTLDVLDDTAALQLLTATLNARRHEDNRLQDDPAGSRRLVELCAGLPLAIVIVGAILAAEPSLAVGELAHELDDVSSRLESLTYGPGLAVSTAFEVSYRRLDDDQRSVFVNMSVAPGPDAALPTIVVLANLPLPRARTALRHLERANLLEPTLSLPSSRRWRMHDLVRLFARAQLPNPAADKALTRALTLYQETTDIAWKRFIKNADVPGGEVFPTPRAALEWVLDERVGLVEVIGRPGNDHALARLLLAADVAPFLERAHFVDDVVRVAEAATRLISEEDTAGNEVPDRVRAVAYGNLGMALQQAGRLAEAVPALVQAGAILQKIGDAHGETTTQMNLGIVFSMAELHGQAHLVLAALPVRFRDLGDPMSEATAFLNLGYALLGQRRLDEALEEFTTARDLFDHLGDPHGSGQARGAIALVHSRRGELTEAAAVLRSACAALVEAGDQFHEAQARDHLGDSLAGAGETNEAVAAYTRSADLYAAVNDINAATRVRAKATTLTAEPTP